jgi:hypothetical protein
MTMLSWYIMIMISWHLLIFFIFSVCFETELFVSVVSKQIRNTETNRKFLLLVSRNKPKINRNRLSFGLFRFEPKKYFDCFEDTLAMRHSTKPNLCTMQHSAEFICPQKFCLKGPWNEILENSFFLSTNNP